MSFLKDLFKGLGESGLKSLNAVLPGLGDVASSTATNLTEGFTNSAIQGIPMPWDKTASQQGKDMRSMMENAFPGTSVWDRLGAGGAGTAQSITGQQQIKTQERLQRNELRSKERIARLQADTSLRVAGVAHGSNALDEINTHLRTGLPVRHFDSMTSLARQKLPSELARIQAETGLTLKQIRTEVERTRQVAANATIDEAMASWADFLAANKLLGTQVGAAATQWMGKILGAGGNKLMGTLKKGAPTSIGPKNIPSPGLKTTRPTKATNPRYAK